MFVEEGPPGWHVPQVLEQIACILLPRSLGIVQNRLKLEQVFNTSRQASVVVSTAAGGAVGAMAKTRSFFPCTCVAYILASDIGLVKSIDTYTSFVVYLSKLYIRLF